MLTRAKLLSTAKLAFAAISVLAFTASCDKEDDDDDCGCAHTSCITANPTVVAEGSYSDFKGTATLVIKNQTSADSLYAAAFPGFAAPAVQAGFDWVVRFSGDKSTGGYTVTFAGERPQPGNCILHIYETSPSGATTQAFSQPWAIVLIPEGVTYTTQIHQVN